ncbi:uncharacterized protein LOC116024463 [Ipomoea triloba]|uniref:uncharacterized protein LOC116024463 n=1 Tax=Ipomoea triloba TaxID=35885 RepID=UPI00125D9EFA|nr:uncharacterized protein LOC116024463 [Ipomoea triloba]
MAIVIYKLPRQIMVTKNGEQNVHDFVVMNEELKPIMLTLWGTFAVNQGVQLELQLRQGKFPIILAEGLNVNAFQGLSLSTLYNTSIEVDPVGHVTKLDLADSNDGLFRQSLMLGNPTKRRLDFSQLSGDSVDDSQASSPPNDKGKKPKIG